MQGVVFGRGTSGSAVTVFEDPMTGTEFFCADAEFMRNIPAAINAKISFSEKCGNEFRTIALLKYEM
jgi:hypothetical protein